MKRLPGLTIPVLFLITFLLTGCSERASETPAASETEFVAPGSSELEPVEPDAEVETREPTSTKAQTPTPAPMAARVNGDEISEEEFFEEIARFQAASGRELTDEDKMRVLDELIDQVLLARAAIENGFDMTDEELSERLQQLIADSGGQQAFESWLEAHNYDMESFNAVFRRGVSAAWMRDRVLAGIPETVEHVHARHILTFSEGEAKDVLTELDAGNSFINLANEYDPVGGGDLGWFPKGYLHEKIVEETAFSLAEDEYSGIIQTPAGYHIIYVEAFDPEYPLEGPARTALQAILLEEWLEEQRQNGDIEILSP